LVDSAPRLFAFSGLVSRESYENIKAPLIIEIKQDKFTLMSILFEQGRLIYCYTESIGGDLMQLQAIVKQPAQKKLIKYSQLLEADLFHS